MSGSGVSSSSLPPASTGGSNLSTSGSGVGGTAAAAAAAAVLEAVSSGSRYPSTAQGAGPPYGNPQDMMMSNKSSDNMSASRMSPMQLGSMLGPNVQTGLHNSYDYPKSFAKTLDSKKLEFYGSLPLRQSTLNIAPWQVFVCLQMTCHGVSENEELLAWDHPTPLEITIKLHTFL